MRIPRVRWPSSAGYALALGCALALLWPPGAARGQAADLVQQIVNGQITGIGIHAGTVSYEFGAAPSSASPELKAFNDMLSSSANGTVATAQVLYRTFILNLAATSATVSGIDRVNPVTGFAVSSAHRDATQAALSWTHPPFAFGLGTESGTMTFQGPGGKRAFDFSNTFALLELYIPLYRGRTVEPLLSVGYAVPLDFGTGSTQPQAFFKSAAFATLGAAF